MSQWHGDDLDSTAKLPLHRDNHAEEERRRREEEHRRRVHRIVWWGVAAVVLLFALIFLLGYLPRHKRDQQNDKQAEARKDATPVVDVAQVRRAPAASELTVPGTTTPLTEANIYARANGYLAKRFVDLGDHVRKGQLLAVIEAPDLDQQVDQARASLRQAESQLAQQRSQLDLARVTWERWKVLVAKGVFSRQDGDQKQTDYEAQLANVAAAERNVQSFAANLSRDVALQDFEHVTAPFDGIVTARNVDVGALISAQGSGGGNTSSSPVSAGSPTQSGSTNTSGSSGNSITAASPITGGAQGGALFSMAQVSRLRIFVSVPEGYSTAIRVGEPAMLHFQEFPQHPFQGEVTRTAGSIDQNSRTLLTEVQVDNRAGHLLNGMYVVVGFEDMHVTPGVTIPGDAVIVRGDKNQVAVVRDGVVHLQPIEIGRDFGPSVEVLQGLHAGELLVTTVADFVKEGVKVQTRQSQAPGQDEASTAGQAGHSGMDSSQYGKQGQVDAGSTNGRQKSSGQHGDASRPGGKS